MPKKKHQNPATKRKRIAEHKTRRKRELLSPAMKAQRNRERADAKDRMKAEKLALKAEEAERKRIKIDLLADTPNEMFSNKGEAIQFLVDAIESTHFIESPDRLTMNLLADALIDYQQISLMLQQCADIDDYRATKKLKIASVGQIQTLMDTLLLTPSSRDARSEPEPVLVDSEKQYNPLNSFLKVRSDAT